MNEKDNQNDSNYSANSDIFANNQEDISASLNKTKIKSTNSLTKILAGVVVIASSLSLGAWYGHSHASAATTNSGSRGFFNGGGNFAGNLDSTTARANGFGQGGNNGFRGPAITGKVSAIVGSKVTLNLDDPTQSSKFKVGDSTRITDLANLPNSTIDTRTANGNTLNNGQSNQSPNSSGSGNGQGFFNNPALQACLKKEGINITPGVRPDRNDPKVNAALQKCFATLQNQGQG